MDSTVMHINKGNAHGTQGERSNPAKFAEHLLLSSTPGGLPRLLCSKTRATNSKIPRAMLAYVLAFVAQSFR